MSHRSHPIRCAASAALLVLLAPGCADFGQVAVVEARKSFRVPLEGFLVEVPDASFDELVGEDEIEAMLQRGGATEAQLDALGMPSHQLDGVGAVVPIAPIRDELEALIVSRIQGQLEDAAQAGLDGERMRFESDFSSWDAWTLDFVDADASIAAALRNLPVTMRLVIEADSLSELIGAGGDETDPEGRSSELDQLGDIDILRTLFLREIGLRTLTPAEVEPDAGWTDDERAEVHAALRDGERVGTCDGDRVELDDDLAARATVQSMADPFTYATLAEVALDGGEPVCGVTLDADDDVDLAPYVDEGLRLVLALESALGTEDHWVGGYLTAGVVARFRLPGSLADLSSL